MPRKKKEKPEEVVVEDKTEVSGDLIQIAAIIKNDQTILGEKADLVKLPRNAEFTPRFLDVATRLIAAGLSEKDLAFVLGTTYNRIRYWKRHNPLFKKACDDGKGTAKSYLIAQGLRAAAGYRTVEKNVKIKRKVLDDGTVITYAAEESVFHREKPADSSLLIFMLCNLSRIAGDEKPWMSQHKIEIDQNKNVNIKISGKVASEQIDRLAGAFMPKEIEAEFVDGKETEKPNGRSPRLPGGDTKAHSK